MKKFSYLFFMIIFSYLTAGISSYDANLNLSSYQDDKPLELFLEIKTNTSQELNITYQVINQEGIIVYNNSNKNMQVKNSLTINKLIKGTYEPGLYEVIVTIDNFEGQNSINKTITVQKNKLQIIFDWTKYPLLIIFTMFILFYLRRKK